MKKMKEKFKKPRLYDADGDLTQRWYVFYSYLNPETNKYQRFLHSISSRIQTSSGRREKAHLIMQELNAKLNEGWSPFSLIEKRFVGLLTALNFVQELKESSVRQRTSSTYKHHIATFRKWLVMKELDKRSVEDFTYHHAQEFMDWTKIKLKHSNRTYNNRITAMVTLFNVLLEREFIRANPFKKITRLPKTESKIISFTPSEIKVMTKHLPTYNYDLYVCACMIFYCFIRPQELARLKVENIDLRKGIITLPGEVSKNKKTEIVVIPVPFQRILLNFDLNYPGSYFVFGRYQRRSPKYCAPTRIAEAWKKFCTKVGLEKNIYSLKHTGVGTAIEHKVSTRDIQLQARHHSLDQTQEYLEKFNNSPSDYFTRHFPDIEAM
jgi:integrase